MSETKHSPAPWRTGAAEGHPLLVIDADVVIVAEVHGRGIEDAGGLANVALIAAAPDLLAALRRAMGYIPVSDGHPGCRHCAASAAARRPFEEALAKAEGREP